MFAICHMLQTNTGPLGRDWLMFSGLDNESITTIVLVPAWRRDFGC